MAQRRRMENSAADMSNYENGDRELEFLFRQAAGELTKLYKLALNKEVAFNAGQESAYARVYEWILSQQQDGKSVTAADISAYLQNELNQMDRNMPVMQQQQQQQQQVGGAASDVPVTDNVLNTQQLPKQLDHETQRGPSGGTDGNAPALEDQEMEIN